MGTRDNGKIKPSIDAEFFVKRVDETHLKQVQLLTG